MFEREMTLCGPVDVAALAPWLEGTAGDAPRGLGGTPVADLARAALAAGGRVRIFTLDPGLRRETVLTGPRLTIFTGPFRERHRARDLFAAEREYLRTVIRREKPRVVHAHWTYEFALGAMESGAPVVVTAHDAPLRVLRLLPSPYRLLRTVMAWEVARQARFLTAVSASVAGHFQRFFGYSAPIRVIPNGLGEEWFPAARERARGRGVVFASVLNGWGPLKNGTAVLEAFARVRGTLPGSELWLFGADHGGGEAGEIWARRRGLERGVRFLGTVAREELRRRLAEGTDVYVHPSREEAFGMTIAEAMALGVPVIAARDGGAAAELLEGGACGVLTDVRSAGALAAEMARLAGDGELRGRLAAAGAASAGRRFRMGAVLAAYGDVCREAGEA